MADLYEKETAVALQAVRQAASLCQAVQHGIEPESLSKKDRSPVTVADFGSQALVCREIDAHFPDDPVIGEEDASMLRKPEYAAIRETVLGHVKEEVGDATEEQVLAWIDRGCSRDHSERFWTIDPIDGTKGFLRGEQYAVALALVVGGKVEVAVLGCPNLVDPHDDSSRGIAFVAVRGEGVKTASLFGEGSGLPVAVSGVEQARDARICESVESGHSSHDDSARVAAQLGIELDSIRLDSQA